MKKLLLADDSASVRSILKGVLFKDFELIEAENGKVALEKAAAERVDGFVKWIPEKYPAPKDRAKVRKGEIQEGDPLPWSANGKCWRFTAVWPRYFNMHRTLCPSFPPTRAK